MYVRFIIETAYSPENPNAIPSDQVERFLSYPIRVHPSQKPLHWCLKYFRSRVLKGNDRIVGFIPEKIEEE